MTPIALIPIGAVPFSVAFDLWWSAVRPSDVELLAERRAELASLKAAGLGARSIDAAEALERLSLASEAGKARTAGIAALGVREQAKQAFLDILARGDLQARVLIGDIERAIEANWWRATTFDQALRTKPQIYFGADFTAWIAAAGKPAAATFDALVAFLRSRLPAAPSLSPAEAADFVAVESRFGCTFKRDVIRQARSVAYGERKRSRGKSKP